MRYVPNILQFSPFDLFKYDDFACNLVYTQTLSFHDFSIFNIDF